MRLWMALVLVNLVIQFVVDPAIQLTRLDYFTVEQAQWAILEPYGLKTSDGLNIAAMLINPFFWYELLSRYVAWDYDVFKGSIWGGGHPPLPRHRVRAVPRGALQDALPGRGFVHLALPRRHAMSRRWAGVALPPADCPAHRAARRTPHRRGRAGAGSRAVDHGGFRGFAYP